MAVILSNLHENVIIFNMTADTYSVVSQTERLRNKFEKSDHAKHSKRQQWRLRSFGILRSVGW